MIEPIISLPNSYEIVKNKDTIFKTNEYCIYSNRSQQPIILNSNFFRLQNQSFWILLDLRQNICLQTVKNGPNMTN